MLKSVLKLLPAVSFMLAANAFAVVNVAVVAPRAGEFKAFGDELVGGVKIAVDDINASGGIGGEKINLVVVDDQCNDRIAVSTAQMMAVNSSPQEKINLVVGPFCDNAFDRTADIYAQAGIFQIVPTAVGKAAAAVTRPGLVKMTGSYEGQGADFYKYYQEHFDGKNVALVYNGEMRKAVEIAAAVQNEFRKHNKAGVLKTYDFAHYGKSHSGLARDVAAQGNRIIYLLGEAPNLAVLARDIKDEDRSLVIFTNRYQTDERFLELLGDLAEGSFSLALPSLKDDPDFTETLVRLRLQGAEPEGLGVYSYSAVKLWQQLVEVSDSFKYNDLAKKVQGRKVRMVWGEEEYKNGNPLRPVNYGIYQLQSGSYTQVY